MFLFHPLTEFGGFHWSNWALKLGHQCVIEEGLGVNAERPNEAQRLESKRPIACSEDRGSKITNQINHSLYAKLG